MNKISYHKHIDGLRAVAVFSVIFYHANFKLFDKSLLSGGFLGVDIFFVISGYLITSIILRELHTTNSFSFANFYERRIRRIIPVLLFLILCTLSFAYIFLLTEPFIDFSKSIISSIFFVSNIYFHYSHNLYGQEYTLFKPLLHTWSLSVEGQFYILFPIFLIIVIKFFKKYLSFFLIIGFLISVFFSQYASIYHVSFNFYQIFSRGFELLIGSLLSYFKYKSNLGLEGGVHKSYKIFNVIYPKLGIFLIFLSLFLFDDKDSLPSFYSLIPLSGVCLIVWFSHKDEIVTKILSNKVLVFFGLISYSLYLFHFPIFAFSRVFEIFIDYYKFILIFLTIIFSIFSYYFIEKPFRDKKFISFKKLIIIILSFIVILILLSFYAIKDHGFITRLPKVFQQKLREPNFKLHQKENLQKIVLIGDSHANSLEYHLNEELKKNYFSLIRFNTQMYLKDFNYVNKKTKQIEILYQGLIQDNNKIDEFLNNNLNLIIVFHQRWSLRILENVFDNEEGYKEYKKEEDKYYHYLEPINIKTISSQEREKYIIAGIKSQIESMINRGHKLILVYPVPEMGFNPDKLLYNHYLKKNFFNKEELLPLILTGSYEVYKKRNKLIFETFDSIQSSNIYRVYPHMHFCDKQIRDRCVANNQENIFYYDNNHLSLQGSKFVVDDILKIIKNFK